ncbi:MAG: glycosyltransferase [Alphaproteobacteria bacterium]
MKFLLIPNYRHVFEYRMLDGLATALRTEGHEAWVLHRPTWPSTVASIVREQSIDVVFQVNRPRPTGPALEPGTRHVTWFQDCRSTVCKTAADRAIDGDLIYYLAQPQSLTADVPAFSVPASHFAPAVDPKLLGNAENAATAETAHDIVMVASMLPPHHQDTSEDTLAAEAQSAEDWFRWWVRKNNAAPYRPAYWRTKFSAHRTWQLLKAASVSKAVMESLFEPLTGFCDHAAIAAALAANPDTAIPGNTWATENMRIAYTRLLNRVAAARCAADISNHVGFYGPGWDSHAEFSAWAHPPVGNLGQMLRLFRSSKIVLHDNPDGCNFHDRVFYGMASGALIMAVSSPWNDAPGGFNSCFKDGVHFAAYDRDTLHDVARRWLSDDDARRKIGETARREVLANHTWRHRAQQLLKDLKAG